MSLLLRLLLALVFVAAALPALADSDVQAFTLDNGMRILVKPDRRALVAVSQVWYRVGGSYEHPGDTGLSHVLEHMMFRGTDKIAPGEFSRIIAGLGGTENAFTARDYTVYYEMLSVQHLGRALQLEADRMHNLKLDPKQFARELQVVREERRLRTDDSPGGLLREQLMAVAWRASPYRNPVVGWTDDLQHMQLAQLRDWYRRWYAPDNATLVVVGDVDPQQVLALAKRYFGPVPRSGVVSPRPIIEPKQRGLSRVQVEAPARQPALIMGYKVPVVGHTRDVWEPYALYVLAAVLDGGNSARLPAQLVRGSEIAASAGASYSGYSRLPTLFTLSGTPAPGHTLAELEQALREQVRQLRQQLIGPQELQRVIAPTVAGKVFQADSMFNQATQLGSVASLDLDWHLPARELAAIRSVTPEQVRSVARRYLVGENLTIAELVPQSLSGMPSDGQSAATATAASRVGVLTSPAAIRPAAPPAAPSTTASAQVTPKSPEPAPREPAQPGVEARHAK